MQFRIIGEKFKLDILVSSIQFWSYFYKKPTLCRIMLPKSNLHPVQSIWTGFKMIYNLLHYHFYQDCSDCSKYAYIVTSMIIGEIIIHYPFGICLLGTLNFSDIHFLVQINLFMYSFLKNTKKLWSDRLQVINFSLIIFKLKTNEWV